MAINTSFGSGSSSGSSSSSSGGQYLPGAQNAIQRTFPYINNALPTSGQTNFGNLLGQVGGATPNYPTITKGPVYTANDIRDRINAMTANNISTVGGQLRDQFGHTGGSGVQAGNPYTSPVSAEIVAQRQGQLLDTNTKEAEDLRFSTAQANASQLLASQQADVARSQAMSEDNIRRRQLALQGQQNFFQNQQGLLDALFNFTRPIPVSSSQSQQQSRQQNSSLGSSFQDNTPMPSISGHIDVAGNRNNFWG